MCAHAGIERPETATEAQLIGWVTAARTNNTVRHRITVALTFLAWCDDLGVPTADVTQLRRLKRSYPKVYGKAQSANPGRWLTYDEAYGALVAVCQDGTLIGLRDELVIRFGLSGLRRAEIATLTWRHLASLPTIQWPGKGNRPRRMTAGSDLMSALTTWRDAYPDPEPTDPVICGCTTGTRPRIDWKHGYRPQTNCLHRIITRRAAEAGLGHVAPHDLRRSAAGILHRATTDGGAHHFDLLDIQKVLGHADPATTMRSYLDPMDTEVIDRAATYLD